MAFYNTDHVDDQIDLLSDNEARLTPSCGRYDVMDTDEPDHLGTFETPNAMCTEASTGFHKSGQRYGSYADNPRDTDSENEPVVSRSHLGQHKRGPLLPRARRLGLYSLKKIPAELLQQVATYVATDSDLRSLNLSSPVFTHTVSSHASAVWRKRFLAKYDFPSIDSAAEFAVAYKLRHFVLNNFLSFEGVEVDKMKIQLEVILDMIIESYNKERPYLPWPHQSRNLAVFQSVDQSSWMTKLLGCPLYASRAHKYGKPFALFESVQLILSHLVLSYKSPYTSLITTSRGNYDLVKVYHFNQTFKTLFERLPSVTRPSPGIRNARYIRTSLREQDTITPKYSLDLNSLLHIRNFWQRHLTDDIRGLGENTYAGMSKALTAWNSYPRPWSRPLHLPLKPAHVWHGMYSCLDPWPKNRDDLEERQSSAEEWSVVDPMKVEFVSSTQNESGSMWPPSFDEIPVFRQMIPRRDDAEQLNCVFLRGTAPFMNISQDQSKPNEERTGDKDKIFLKYHPFTAARVRGVVHDIPESATFDNVSSPTEKKTRKKSGSDQKTTIPGWKRVVMVMYRSFPQHLISVLDHALEEYGVASMEAAYNTAEVWNDPAEPQDDEGDDEDSTSSTTNATTPPPDLLPLYTESDPDNTINERDPGSLNRTLSKRIRQFTKKYRRRLNREARLPADSRTDLPALFSTEHINQLEESFVPSAYLSWNDETTQIIDYAYAYEGVVIPGGQIMMGRWWRIHGSEGLGPGREVGVGGVGIEVRRVKDEEETGNVDEDEDEVMLDKSSGEEDREGMSVGNARDDGVGDGKKVEFITQVNGEETRAVNGCKGLERGPFIIWACD